MEEQLKEQEQEKSDSIQKRIDERLQEKIRSGEIDPNDKDAIQKFLNEE